MRFVDLFVGLGGFHLALRELDHICVFACEIDETLRSLYEKNFNMQCAGDIRGIDPRDIPSHDILCAGFPCQPFSKAGGQEGFHAEHTRYPTEARGASVLQYRCLSGAVHTCTNQSDATRRLEGTSS